jgi:hypothetical protein
MTVRRTGLVLLAVLVGLSVAPLGSAQGSCAGPQLSVTGATADPPVLYTGRPLVVEGRHFVEGCEDEPQQDSVLGCSAGESESEETPMTSVRLTLVQGDRKWSLGTADAGTGEERADRGHTTWEIRLPKDVVTGRATLVAGTARLPVVLDVVRHAG